VVKSPDQLAWALLEIDDDGRLDFGEAAIRKWIYQRRLPAVKVGRLTRLRVSDLEALLVKGLPGR
jgi:excisionase family DNA binding protein